MKRSFRAAVFGLWVDGTTPAEAPAPARPPAVADP